MSYTAFNRAHSHHYDPLQLCSSAVLWPPFPHPRRRPQIQKRRPKLGGSLIFQDLYKVSSSRGGAFAQTSRRVCLRLCCSLSTFKLPRESISWNSSLTELEACKVFINTDNVSSTRSRKGCRQHGSKHHAYVRTHVFNPQGGGGGGSDSGRTIFNLAGAGLLTYLTVTGRLNWLFDAILSLWLISTVLWWFAERSLVRGPCPNCGGEFQVFEFSPKEEQRLCPYCSQPFKLENKKFVRDEPQFFNEQTRGSKQPFGGFGGFEGFEGFNRRSSSSRKKEDSSGVIVDIEAEVRDKD